MDDRGVTTRGPIYLLRRWLWLLVGVIGAVEVVAQVIGVCRGSTPGLLVTRESSIHFLASLAIAVGGAWFWWAMRQRTYPMDGAAEVEGNR